MPELPEVETTRLGIQPWVEGRRIASVTVRNRNLRWPVTTGFGNRIQNQLVHTVTRRGKYLLLNLDRGAVIIHLGMSGHLRVVDADTAIGKHDHIDILFDAGKLLRLNDPRRFGAVLYTGGDPLVHPLLAGIGPEPLGDKFTADYLFHRTRSRSRCIRDTLLDGNVVAGIGNIYANEALFAAGIDPRRAANRVSLQRYQNLVVRIRDVLARAIQAGGTTLRDFRGGDGRPGYFQQTLAVYGRQGQPCVNCASKIRGQQFAGRSLFYCVKCQK